MQPPNINSNSRVNLQTVCFDSKNKNLNNSQSETKNLVAIIAEQEKNIFFPKKDTEETTSKFQPEIDYIKQEHFETTKTFISFSKSFKFVRIKNKFIADINIFTELCLFYLQDSFKNNFNYEISALKNKIKTTQFYGSTWGCHINFIS